MKNRLYMFVNEHGNKYFKSVRRTNHFIVLKIDSFADREEMINKVKRVDDVVFFKVQNDELWIRIRKSLNGFMNKLNGELEIEPFDKFDKELWIWYIENETPFRYRWLFFFFWWRMR